MAKLSELNQDILLLISTFLKNRDLVCLALVGIHPMQCLLIHSSPMCKSFSGAFKASHQRSYWKQKPSSLHFDRLVGWNNYTAEELRRASLRAYLTWMNWTSVHNRPKSRYNWPLDEAPRPIAESRWNVSFQRLMMMSNISFLDVLTGKTTKSIQIPVADYLLTPSVLIAPNEFIIAIVERYATL